MRDEDTSFMHDSTPAANKVDRSQIDGGNMVNVICQALEMRLGKDAASNGEAKELDGSMTSAAMMASDFLLEELRRIETDYPGDARAPILDDRGDDNGRPQSAMAKGGYAASYGFDATEEEDYNRQAESDEMNALWGGGGIPMTNDDESISSKNLNRDW